MLAHPKVLYQSLNIDDFAIEADGSVLAATHVYNSLIRIAPGAAGTIAGPGAWHGGQRGGGAN